MVTHCVVIEVFWYFVVTISLCSWPNGTRIWLDTVSRQSFHCDVRKCYCCDGKEEKSVKLPFARGSFGADVAVGALGRCFVQKKRRFRVLVDINLVKFIFVVRRNIIQSLDKNVHEMCQC